jgi:hypothetical protein
VLPTALLSQRFGIKQDVLGESISQYTANNHLAAEPDLTADPACLCSAISTTNATMAKDGYDYRTTYRFYNQHLVEITATFSTTQAREFIEQFSHKYGTPSNYFTETDKNDQNIEVSGDVVVWEHPDSLIVLKQLGPEPHTSKFTISDNAYIEMRDKAKTPQI